MQVVFNVTKVSFVFNGLKIYNLDDNNYLFLNGATKSIRFSNVIF
jgi:hypothetical protein